jgi:micrococcal nuclease
MERVTILFWGIIAVLLSASLFFAIGAEKQRRELKAVSGKLESGDLVTLVRVLDGDTIVVVREGDKPVTIRILGIKALDAKVEKDIVTPFGRAAVESLQRMLSGRSARVMLHTVPNDRHGRYLATLYCDGKDLGLSLVRQGLALVYTVYPFPAMPVYLQEQELSRAGRRGLWANTEVADRALALMREWEKQTK